MCDVVLAYRLGSSPLALHIIIKLDIIRKSVFGTYELTLFGCSADNQSMI